LKIKRAEFIPLCVKGTSTLRISKGATQIVHPVVIKLETDEGLTGIAEAISGPPGYPEELQKEIMAALNCHILPVIINEDPQNISAIRVKMDRVLNGKYWTKAAVINALYDLLGKAHKKPVCELAGGAWKNTVPNLTGMAGMDTTDNMVKKAVSLVENGAATIKLKIGETVNADVDRIRAVREAVGNKIGIRVDANSHYQAENAIALIRKIEKYNILHVEAPVDKNDLLGMASVKKAVKTPIMSDENVRIPIEAMNLIKLDAVDIIKIKVTKMGFDLAESILKLASDNGKKCILGHMMELGVAGTAEAHFALAHPELIEPHEIGSFRMIGIAEDIIDEPVDHHPNCFTLHMGDGLGVTLNQEWIEQHRVDT
jgi:L-alanine-DL-glutamate epimerase-like enolase superfamily enzyme